MHKRILAVFKGTDYLGGEVKQALLKRLEGGDVMVDLATSAAEAKQRLSSADYQLYGLVITHVDIPVDSRTSDPEGREGLRLLQWLEKKEIKIPSVLMVPSGTVELLSAVNKLTGKCYVLDFEHSENWQQDLVDRTQVAVRSEGAQPPKEREGANRVNVDISVAVEKTPLELWHVEFKVIGGVSTVPMPVEIQVEPDRVNRLLRWSDRIKQTKGQHPLWEGILQDIGEEMREILFRDRDFVERFSSLQQMVGGLESFRFRFKVKKSAHPVILEALAQRGEGNKWEYWMLKAPIYRSVWTGSGLVVYQRPLFQGERQRGAPLNCLIIKSDVGGWVDVEDRELERLENIEEEANFLETFLRDRVDVNRVKRIPEKEGERCTSGLVRKWLTEKGPWDLVHYAGHSIFDPNDRVGYICFAGEERPKVTLVDCEHFSMWLREAKTRFIYLSSCRSSEEDFLFGLADHGIPSALGFRWDIKDKLAAKHAEIFYKHLLQCCSLEYAFLYTRKEMYEEDKKEMIWAAPILLMQISD